MSQISFLGLSVRAGLVLCLCLLSSLTHAIVKPAFDHRDYRHVTLDNGLEAILVSDRQASQGAFALEVAVGSLADPQHLGGLAHLVEHAILLGDSSKRDGGFRKFVSAHRGKQGGQTSYEFTRYQVSLNSDALAEALMRFGDLLDKPRFSADALADEIEILDEEFALVRDKAVWRYRQPLKAVTAPDHPFRQFAPGNRDSLSHVSKEQLHAEAVGFIQRHYRPQQMRLVVIGNQSLDQLERMTRAAFGKLVATPTKASTPYVLLDSARLPARIDIRTQGDSATLNLLIPLPRDGAISQYKPVEYLKYLLEHQGPDSLQDQLRDRGYIHQLRLGSGLGLGGQQTLSFTLVLTRQGLEQLDQLVAELFSAFATVREQALDPKLYDAFRDLLAVQEFMPRQESPKELAIHLLKQWQDYPAAEVRRGEFHLAPYNAERLKHFFQALQAHNSLLVLAHDQAQTDQYSEQYRIAYGLHPVTPEQLSLWQQVRPMEQLTLAPEAAFMPHELDILPAQNDATPVLAYQGEGVQLWKAFHRMGDTPRTRLYIALKTPGLGGAPHQKAQGELWLKALQRRLKPIQDQAAQSGQSLRLYSHADGLTLRLNAFRDQSVELARAALLAIQPALSQKEFDLAKAMARRDLASPSHKYAFEPLVDNLGSLLDVNRPPASHLIDALTGVSFEDFSHSEQQFRNQMQYVALYFGQVSSQDQERLVQLLTAALPQGSFVKTVATTGMADAKPLSAPIQLHNGERQLHRLALKGKDHALLFYHQAEPSQAPQQALRTEAILRMLTPLLQNSYFEEIRNRRQLAYGVLVVPFRFAETPGLSFIVQSRQTDPAQLTSVTEQFLTDFAERLHRLSPKTFRSLQASLVDELNAEASSADELAGDFWREINSGGKHFSKPAELIGAIKSLKKADLIAYAETHLAGQQQRSLILQGWSDAQSSQPVLANSASGPAVPALEKAPVSDESRLVPPHPSVKPEPQAATL